jgi:16S rRNA (guanine527-N7)-methyltransferase
MTIRENFITEFASEFNVSRETIDDFLKYEELLLKWSKQINLISLKTKDDIWLRHFTNSARLYKLVDKSDMAITDFGTGAGFPGLVLAILDKDKSIKREIRLIDENYKRIAFLGEVARSLKLKLDIICSRVEDVMAVENSIVTARAFAPLDKLLNLSYTYAQVGARLLFLKGKDVKNEIEIARIKWEFDFIIYNLDDETGSCILEILNLKSGISNEKQP